MDLDGLVESATLERMRRAEAGDDVRRVLRIASLRPGDVGVLRARVASVAPARTFRRKNGTEGLVGRVTFDDGTGEVDGVLWDDLNRLTRDGTLAPGKTVELAGVVVQDGWRGGLELSLEAATVTEVPASSAGRLAGVIDDLGTTDIVEGRFQAEMGLRTAEGSVRVVVWDELVKELRDRGVGAEVTLEPATPHPLLDGWYLADGARLQ